MSCSINFRTSIYDDAIEAFFKCVSPVTRKLEGAKTTYTFFGYDNYRVIVDDVAKEISVECEADGDYNSKTGTYNSKGIQAVDPWSYPVSKIEDDVILALIKKDITNTIKETLAETVGLQNAQDIDIRVDLPGHASHSINDAFRTREQKLRNSGEIYHNLIGRFIYDQANMFVAEQPRRYGGSGMLLAELNFFWAHRTEIAEIQAKHHRLASHLHDYFKNGWRPADYVAPRYGEATILGRPEDWHKRRKSLVTDLRNYVMRKFTLTKSELNEWLTIDEQKFKWITKYGASMGHGIALQVLREVGRTPAMAGLEALDSFWRRVAPTALDKNFVRQLLVEALKNSIKVRHRMGVDQWLELEWHQVSDWFAAEGRAFRPDKNQRNAKWSWFVRHSEEWHDIRAIARMDASAPTDEWSSLLPQHVAGDFLFVPLLSNKDLFVEGESQAHCVGGSSYIDRSRSGEILIWSIRSRENNRLATFEIRRTVTVVTVKDEYGNDKVIDKYVWTKGQCSGKRNSTVDTPTKEAADQLLARYNASYMGIWHAQRQMEHDLLEAARKKVAAKRRYEARIAKRFEKIMEADPTMNPNKARSLAAEEIANEEREKAEKKTGEATESRKTRDNAGRVLVIQDHPDDEVPPPIEDADDDWIILCEADVTLEGGNPQRTQVLVGQLAGRSHTVFVMDEEAFQNRVPQGYDALVAEALMGYQELPVIAEMYGQELVQIDLPLPQGPVDVMLAHLDEQLEQAIDALAVPAQPLDEQNQGINPPQPVEVAA